MRSRPIFTGIAATFTLSAVLAQEPVDLNVITRIRNEGFKNSEVMETLWHLTDRYGPRLTNSPQERAASAWARDRMTEFGLSNAHLEAWGDFGHGWSFERCVVEMTEPTYMPLIAIPKAWTPGTGGQIKGTPILVSVESEEDIEQYKGKLEGRIVLNGKVNGVESYFEPLAERHDDESLAEIAKGPIPAPSSGEGGRSDWRARRALRDKITELFKAEGVAVVIEPDGGRRRDYGVITLGSGGSRDPDEEKSLPQVVVSTEHFNRIARLVSREHEVRMSVDVRTTFYADDTEGRNVIAEIPGTDPILRDEVVMLGAHFDSWHPGTGATDNGAASAVVMEAARILKAIGAGTRRTVRVALWTGEEQGLLGSRGYVAQHFASPDDMRLLPEHHGLAAYFNLDNGAGMIRGVYMQENAAVRPIFAAWLEPFHDLGAETLTFRTTGGTDHLSFDAVGLPGFQFIQEPLDYGTRTHHTNMDLYERVHPGDVMQASVVLASFAYHAANRTDKLPRKPLPPARVEDE